MCVPLTIPLLAGAASIAGTAAGVHNANQAKKSRRGAAYARKLAADRAKTEADEDLRSKRKEVLSEKSRTKSEYRAQPSVLFSPRSFFSAN